MNYAKLDDRKISQEEWDRYNKAMEAWRSKYKSKITTFEAGMSRPNPPNYYRANND